MAANRYSPSALVVVFNAVWVPVLVKVTSALATAAPVLSLTAPVIEPVPCANNVGANRISSGKSVRQMRCMQMLLFFKLPGLTTKARPEACHPPWQQYNSTSGLADKFFIFFLKYSRLRAAPVSGAPCLARNG